MTGKPAPGVVVLLVAALQVVVLAACHGRAGDGARVVAGGSAELGARAMVTYGCGACHTIPGVKGADALVGPPLTKFGRRAFVAGKLANTPANLMQWIQHPQDVVPGNDMPDVGVTEDDARNIAAYLEQLR
jgi:cytochrome c1